MLSLAFMTVMRELGWRFLVPYFILNGILGACIADGTFEFAQSTQLSSSIAAASSEALASVPSSLRYLWAIVWLPAFCSTITLLPVLVTFLLRTHRSRPGQYWWRAAAAGVAFGVAACAGTGFYLPIFIALSTVPHGLQDWFGRLATILFGPFLFAMSFGILFPFMFFSSILLTGILFGLINGAAIRWRVLHGSPSSASR